MLLTKSVKLKWYYTNKKHYIEKGYVLTNIGDEFEVKVKDLPECTRLEVEVLCDYCGEIYKKHYQNYVRQNQKSNINKDCCKNCQPLKSKESTVKKYGVDNISQLESIKEAKKKTLMNNYQVEQPMYSEEIKDRLKSLI